MVGSMPGSPSEATAVAISSPQVQSPPSSVAATVLGLPPAAASDVDPTRPLGPAAQALLAAAGYASDGTPVNDAMEAASIVSGGGPFTHDVVVAVALAHSG